MPFSAIQAYAWQLPALQAEMRLMLGEAASAPHWTEDSRRSWVRELLNEMTGRRPQRARVAPRALLAMKGILVTNAR